MTGTPWPSGLKTDPRCRVRGAAMKMEKPHGGTQGIGKGLVKRGVSWGKCFTILAGSQELVLLAAILAGGLLI